FPQGLDGKRSFSKLLEENDRFPTERGVLEMAISGFRLGIYVCKDAEIVDFAAPYGVFAVARRFDPELEAFLIADAMRPVQAQAGFTVLPNYSFADRPAMDAFLIPGGFGLRQEIRNARLQDFIRALPEQTLLTSVCTGSLIYGQMGLLDGLPATSRKEPDRVEAKAPGKVPIDRLADIAPACVISRARIVDAGRMITAGGDHVGHGDGISPAAPRRLRRSVHRGGGPRAGVLAGIPGLPRRYRGTPAGGDRMTTPGARVVSVNVGAPRLVRWCDRDVLTSIFKE